MPNLVNWALLHKKAQIMSENRGISDRRSDDRRSDDRRLNSVDVAEDRRTGNDRRQQDERRSSEDRRS